MAGPEVSPFFVRAVKHALQNLYDPDILRKSPLVGLLDLDPAQGATPLRQLLITAIESLKPDPSVPRDSRPWRVYWILFYLYVSQFSRPMVANNLALSVRQVIREETHAVHVMADYLWSRHNVAAKMVSSPGLPSDQAQQADETMGPTQEDELLWLAKSLPLESVALTDVIARAVATIQPLLTRRGICIHTQVPEDLPNLLLPSDILYQGLLNCLTAVTSVVAGGAVTIRAETGSRSLRVTIEVAGTSPDTSASDGDSLTMARRLLHLLDATLEVSSHRPPRLTLFIPVAERLPVLVLDDNADALALFQRYLTGTRYAFVGTRDPQEALRLAELKKPQVILLDVMLPGMDGWQVLQRLLHAPSTQRIPVVVCSILPEEQLALAMGAAGYLRKPVSQGALLAALDQALAEAKQGSPASPE